MLTFRLIEKCYQDASFYKDKDVDFLLEENDWNDYQYYTTYHLHITTKKVPSDNGATYLGVIHIMRMGQKEDECNVLRKYLLLQNLKNNLVFTDLPQNFYSISFSIDLFKGLSRYLNEEERKEFIQGLRLILKETDDFYFKVKEEDVFNTSLLRNSTMKSYTLLKGRSLLLLEGVQYNLREQNLTIQYTDCAEEVSLDFSTIKGIDSSLIPNGIIAFIGKNGSGKSTSLYKLAALLYASPGDRDRYMKKDIGTLKPKDIGISQLMIFSYSPFDNFKMPGEFVTSDLKNWVTSLDDHSGRFIYCGLRDVKAEAEEILVAVKNHDEEHKQEIRVKDVRPKSLSSLSAESQDALRIIEDKEQLKHEYQALKKAAQTCQEEIYEILNSLDLALVFGNWESEYTKLSTGHKFFIHSMLHIIAYCEENAILMFDEPENHLQAPLLSFMLAEVRKILVRRRSVMLIATHSPVILQETMSSNVRIVRRQGNHVSFSKPMIETFGENFGTISSEVFDLTTDRTHYFQTIDSIYNVLKCAQAATVEEAVKLIDCKMGGISSQTIHYIVSKYSSDHSL